MVCNTQALTISWSSLLCGSWAASEASIVNETLRLALSGGVSPIPELVSSIVSGVLLREGVSSSVSSATRCGG